jgi:outer membrane protein TolC
MQRFILFVAALVLAALPATAEDLTLPDAVTMALERNPQMRVATAQRRAAGARLAEVRSYWLPRADVTETWARSNNPVFVFGSLLEQGRFGPANFDPSFLNNPDPLTNWRIALNVRYSIFDQFRRLNMGRQAARATEQADLTTEEARQRTRADVLARFYGVLLAQAKREVAADAVRTAESDAKAMRDKFSQGLLVESDALAAEVQLAQFRQQEIDAEGDLAVARAALNTTLEREIDSDTTVRGELKDVALPETTLNEALARGLSSRGEARSAKLGAENARLQTEIARGSLLPRIDTFATWGASGAHASDRNSDHIVGVMASFDVFDPSKLTRIAEARAGLEMARAGESGARDKVSMEIVSAYYRVLSARQRVDLAAKAVAQAEAAARIVHDRYQQGLTTITEQLRAQTALVSARLNLLGARYDYVTGYAELLRASGGLHDVDLFS